VALERLHKRMTVAGFAAAAGYLGRRGVALRVFLLISPPFVPPREQDEWLMRSIDCALSLGASAVSLIPTRSGNGALDALAAGGEFHAPALEDIERSAELVFARRIPHARIFVDLWDLERFAQCGHCAASRRARLHAMNLDQQPHPRLACGQCTPTPTSRS
jgi:hypothetical protein